MQPTTSRRQSSKPSMPSRSPWVGIALLVVAGCSPAGTRLAKVSSRIEAAPRSVPPRQVALSVQGDSRTIEGEPEFRFGRSAGSSVVLVSSDGDWAETEREALAEVERDSRRLRQELDREVATDFDQVYDRIHAMFVAQAPPVGDDWKEIAFLVGFPDPGEPRVPAPVGTMKALEEAEAKLARARIGEAADRFRSEVLTLLEEARSRRRTKQTELEVRIALMKDEALRKAREQSVERRAQLVEVASDLGNIEVRIPASPGATGHVPALSYVGPGWPSAPRNGWRFSQREARLQRLFLALRGRQPSVSAREDLTQEYRHWAGPSKAGR